MDVPLGADAHLNDAVEGQLVVFAVAVRCGRSPLSTDTAGLLPLPRSTVL